MYIIIGIDHPRIVGINEKDGQAHAFDPQNKNGYREPQDEKEEAEMLLCGKKYYDECLIHTMPFGILNISEQPLKALSENPDLFKIIANSCVIEDPASSKIFIRKCRYCGNLFRPQSPRQEVCKRKECQSRRNVEKTLRNQNKQDNK